MDEGRAVTGKGRTRHKRRIALIVGAVVLVIVILQGMRSLSEKAGVASDDETQPPTPRLAIRNQPEKPALEPAIPPALKDAKSPVSKDAPRSYQEAVRRRHLRRLEERWQGEREGRDWTHRIEQRFREEFQNRQIPGKMRQLACRQTLCRLQIAFDSPDDAAKINGIEHDVDTGWYSDFQLMEGEQVIVTAYLGAPGVELRDIIDDPLLR